MTNKADVLVDFTDNYKNLSVKCIITFENPIIEFCFSLNSFLTIDSITANQKLKIEICKSKKYPWQPESADIKISAEESINEIFINYHGLPEGWCNIIEERRIAVNSYSVWAICETSVPVKFLFKLNNLDNYYVINARYDELEKLWIYGETEHDADNIIALKNGEFSIASVKSFNFYYLSNSEKAYADNYIIYYNKIIKYYSSIFIKKDISRMDIVSLDLSESNGGYFRKELVVISKLSNFKDSNSIRKETISFLGHELGHNWFMGADTSLWEDWLNETGAEWAALLFILSTKDFAFFNEKISDIKERYKETPIIKSPDLKRPEEGVHIRGVMLFYEIYCKYGTESIQELLHILSGLYEVTTENFLSVIKKNYNPAISDFIEHGLNTVDYGVLLW